MRILTFDSEQITSCPMNEVATVAECCDCPYSIEITHFPRGDDKGCIYEDKFPGPVGAVEE